ncbi:FAD binding domain-containing protein [Chloroflexota bacterium]
MTNPEYFTPKSVAEAIPLLLQYGGESRIIAGGTDLLVQMKNKMALPDFLINIGGISDLKYINYDAISGINIGALTTIDAIEDSSLIQSKFGVLAQAAGSLGTAAIRNKATIGGNLCNAAPSADTAPVLMVLGATVKIAGIDGEKIVAIEDFFTGPGQTVVKPGELLLEIQIPDRPLHSGAAYLKQKRRQGSDIAVAGVAASVVMEGEILRDVKIALGAVAPTPIRAKKAEETLKGKKLDDRLLEESGQAASRQAKPVDDTRSSADYRRKLVAILVKRAVRQAVEQA